MLALCRLPVGTVIVCPRSGAVLHLWRLPAALWAGGVLHVAHLRHAVSPVFSGAITALRRYYFFFLICLSFTLGVFLSADLKTTFLFFELMSLGSYVWVVQEETPEALDAGKTYLTIAVLGGLVTLMGLFLLQHLTGTLVLSELKAACAAVTDRTALWWAALCVFFGFAAKAGVFPLHIWLPKAHPVAPAPASALLSGVLTKAGIFGILVVTVYLLPGSRSWGVLVLILGCITMVLGAVMAVNPGLAGTAAESLLGIVSYAEERTASVNATNLNVRSGPGTSYQALAKLSKGAPVTVLGEQTGTDGVVWYQIRYSGSGGEQTGYVSSKYIKFPTAIKSDSDFESYLTKQGFPESYKQGLRELHAQYPNWTFTAFQTNLDWNTALKNESVIGRNLVASSSISSWKSTETGAYDWGTGTWPGFDGSSWVQASSDIIAYYMDPRNFLNDKYIYQFMKQSYDSSLHTKTGLQNMVSGTFLSGTVSGGSSVSAGTGSSSGSSSSGSATGPGSSSGSSGSSAGLSSPIASISDHKTERVAATNGPGMAGDGFSSNNADGETAPVSSGTSNKSSGTTSSTAGTTSGSTSAPGSSTTGTTSGSTSSGRTSAPGSGTSSSSGTSTGVAQQSAIGTSYVDIIMNAASESGVNPYILASMILQEQGSQGTGRSISGTVSGLSGLL